MTRKHFIEIARAINEQREEILDSPFSDDERIETLRSTAIRMASVFGGFNEQFDYQRFLTACGF